MTRMDPELVVSILIFFALPILIFIILYIIRYYKYKEKKYRTKYPSNYKCLDGHKCRSLSELIIDNCLYRNGIIHIGEDYIKKEAKRKYKFDWYLPDVNIYLEFFGYSGKNYHKNRVLKEKFYKKHHLTMIAFEPMDLIKIDEQMEKKLDKYWAKILQTKHCPKCGNSLDNRF